MHSPHTWTATGATFLIFAISDLIVSFTVDVVDVHRLWALTAVIGAIGVTILSTRPPERGSPMTHVLVAAVYGGVTFAVWAHAPQGSAPMITGVFVPVLIALWIEDRRQASAHLCLAAVLLLAAALTGGNDPQTLAATICFIPACGLLYVVTNRVLDALDVQGAALDDLALRDPLTGVGNRRALDEEFAAELIRHRSASRPLALIDVAVADLSGLTQRVGRSAADSVLVGVANVLTRHAPAGATIACDGDHFLVILPNTGGEAALAFTEQVRGDVPAKVGGAALELRAGIASYPLDGTSRTALRSTANDRRAVDAPRRRTPSEATGAAWPVVLGGFDVAPPPVIPLPVTRPTLATNRLIWSALGAGLLLYTVVASIAYVLIDDFAGPALPYVAACGLVGSIVALVSRPPRIGEWPNHVAIAATYLLPIAAMMAAAPQASWAIGTALLAPLLIAVRLTDRRQISMHLGLATLLLPVAAVISGFDPAADVAMAALIVNTWVLGTCTLVVFEAAERQSAEIAGLVLRDPLTGTGNRALLRQRVREEIARHEGIQMPLVLIEFDLAEFPAFAAEHGRSSANTLLRDLAVAAASAAGPRATVARLTGSTFGILLPLTDFSEHLSEVDSARETQLDALVAALNEAWPEPTPVVPRVGFAQYPEDASDAGALEALAASRRGAQAVVVAERRDLAPRATRLRRSPQRGGDHDHKPAAAGLRHRR